MTIITVTKDDDQTTEFKFEETHGTITLGRRSTNDVCIPDLSISGSHATIAINESSVILEDLNSTNGTYVNGQVIQRTAINPGDEIIMGKIIIGIKDVSILAPEHAQRANGLADLEGDARSDVEVEAYSSVNRTATQSAGVADHRFSDSVSAGAQVLERESAEHAAPAARGTQAFSPDPEPDIYREKSPQADDAPKEPAHPLDGLEHLVVPESASEASSLQEADARSANTKGAVIEIKNGAKSGQILPIDKPVTTLGRPGIQIAAIMRKPHGYFLMHIESNEDCDQPTLNNNPIGDEPVPLQTGDELTVAGIDVEFMLS